MSIQMPIRRRGRPRKTEAPQPVQPPESGELLLEELEADDWSVAMILPELTVNERSIVIHGLKDDDFD